MASNRTLNYLIDTSDATRVEEFSWPCSVYSESVLCPNHMVHQGENCVCYGLTVSEATRAAINLKTGANIPKLSAMEVIKNCHDIKSKGYKAPMALEWIVNEGIVEDSVMPLDLDAELVKGKAENGQRYQIDDWKPVPNCDAHMKSYVISQPVVVSLDCPPSLFTAYNGELIDPYLMQKAKNANSHSMLLVGFGFYAFPNRSIKDYWQLKTPMGKDSGKTDYIYVLRNSSQSINKWIVFDPVVPIYLANGEKYKTEDLVVVMSLEQWAEFERTSNLDLIVLFYESEKDDKQILRDFERVSRFYLQVRDDLKFIRVEVTRDDVNESTLNELPVIKVYKHIEESEGRVRCTLNRCEMRKEGEKSFRVIAEFLHQVNL